MSMRSALNEDTPVKAVLRQAVQWGIGLFVAGFLAHGYVQSAIAEAKAEAYRLAAEVRAETRRELDAAIARERERTDYVYLPRRDYHGPTSRGGR